MKTKNRLPWVAVVVVGVMGMASVLRAEQAPDLDQIKQAYKRPAKIPYPESNPYSKEKETLGKVLFFDPRVSGSNMISCATCHNPSFSWGDALAKGVGHGHKLLGRRTPTILNAAWGGRQFWDGRAADLEEQALGPIASAGEMNMKLEGPGGLLERLKGIHGYHALFEAAFPGQPISKENVGKAIATFERTVVSGEAPFDRFVEGKNGAISESAKRGFALFNSKAKCVVCHSGWNFTDGSFHDIGVPGQDIGRGKFLKLKSMQFAFKTPTLRNATMRAPFMHDGTEATLEQVVEFYNLGGRAKRPNRSPLITPLGLSTQEKQDLVAFLETLTSEDQAQSLPVLPR